MSFTLLVLVYPFERGVSSFIIQHHLYLNPFTVADAVTGITEAVMTPASMARIALIFFVVNCNRPFIADIIVVLIYFTMENTVCQYKYHQLSIFSS